MNKLILAIFLLSISLAAEDLHKELDLKGQWRFEIGDNLDYAAPHYNDSRWEYLNVPATWEDEGFPGYNGYGWYRYEFYLSKNLKNKNLVIKLGQIDDVDRCYVNGVFIGGHGDFQPRYQTAFDVTRIYELPSSILKFGKKNIVAVRIFDQQGVGGIVYGDMGIFSRSPSLTLHLDLSGTWKIKKGDQSQWSDPNLDDHLWKNILVPCQWELQGLYNLNGYAWYRKSFMVPKQLAKEKLILVLGKIDDYDQVFFNGVQIGETGDFPAKKNKKNKAYNTERAYFIPDHLVNLNENNTVAVRVYDYGQYGGIYSGYIGITTRADWLKYQKKKK